MKVTVPGGVTVNVELRGPESAPPVLLLHAFPLSHRMWAPQLDAFSDRYRMIAPDCRGHGESDAGDGQYTIELLVDDVVVDPTTPPQPDHWPDLLGGVTTLRLRGAARPFPQSAWPYAPAEDRVHDDPAPEADLTAVPYYAWANRGTGPMRVWLPRA